MKRSKRTAATLKTGLCISLQLGVFVSLISCSAETESDQPGSCKLSCSKKYVAAAEYEIVPLIPEGANKVTMACDYPFATQNVTVGNADGPLQVKYMVYEKVTSSLGGTATGTGTGTGTGTSTGTTSGSSFSDPILSRRPVAGVGFDPYIIAGALSVDKTNPEHKAGDEAKPFKYAGIVTPSSEWCSDSCGVMTYEVWPLCLQGKQNTITASISAAAATVAGFFQFILDNTTTTN